MDLEGVVGSVVGESAGMELVDLTFRREGKEKILHVTVDREGGLNLDAIAVLSQRISRRLDAEGFDPGGRYSLEVTSPGVERPLKRPEDFTKRIGQKVKVKTNEPVDSSHVHVGALAAADDAVVIVATETGERRIAHDNIASARTVFEWGPKPKRRAK